MNKYFPRWLNWEDMVKKKVGKGGCEPRLWVWECVRGRLDREWGYECSYLGHIMHWEALKRPSPTLPPPTARWRQGISPLSSEAPRSSLCVTRLSYNNTRCQIKSYADQKGRDNATELFKEGKKLRTMFCLLQRNTTHQSTLNICKCRFWM